MKRIFFLILMLPTLALATQPAVHSYVLKNGLKLFVKVDRRAPVVMSQLWYKVGSSYEHNGITGISHLLEHLMFSGTKQFPKGRLIQLIHAAGGMQNAATSRDYTFYFQELPVDKLALTFKLEADRMANLDLTRANFLHSLAIVKEEKRLRVDNDPVAKAMEQFFNIAFVASPYRYSVGGWWGDLKQMSFAEVKRWYRTWYVPNNAILVVVGDVVPSKVYQLAKQYFGRVKARPLPKLIKPTNVQPFGLRQLTLHLPAKLPLLVMGYNVPTFKTASQEKTAVVLFLIEALLDSGSNSRLEAALIRQQELAVDVEVDYLPMQRFSGEFILSGVPAEGVSLQRLEKGILQQIKRLQTNLVGKEELNRAKTQLLANQVYQSDSLFEQAREIGALEALSLSWQEYDRFLQQVNQVTAAQIQSVAKQYFTSSRLTILKMIPDEKTN